jgi:hypothetical protein
VEKMVEGTPKDVSEYQSPEIAILVQTFNVSEYQSPDIAILVQTFMDW